MSEETHAAVTPVDTTKKSITRQLSPLLLSNLVLNRMENGGHKEISDSGGVDRL